MSDWWRKRRTGYRVFTKDQLAEIYNKEIGIPEPSVPETLCMERTFEVMSESGWELVAVSDGLFYFNNTHLTFS